MSLIDSASLIVTPNGYKEGKLYSVIPSDGSGDMSVVRATTATRVNTSGLVELVPYNLLTYSEQFDNAYWQKLNGGIGSIPTVTANTATSPDGTLTADRIQLSLNGGTSGSDISYINANVSTTAATFSIYAKSNTTPCTIYFRSGSTVTTINITTEWQRFEIYSSGAITVAQFGLRGGSEGGAVNSNTADISVWGAQLNEGSTALPYQKTETRLNIPRLDYSNGTCPSLLVEPQRTNLALQSSSFDNAAWVKLNLSITSNNAIAPDGTLTADKSTPNTVSGGHYFRQTVSVSIGTTYTATIYAKAAGYNFMYIYAKGTGNNQYRVFDLQNGTLGISSGTQNSSIESVGNGWYRCVLTWTQASISIIDIEVATLSSNSVGAFAGDGISGIYAWGAQLEAGYPTSYIPTSGSTVTRNADVISKTGISSLIGQTEGTLFLDFYFKTPSGTTEGQIAITDNTGDNRVIIWNNFTLNTLGIQIKANGTDAISNISLGSFVDGTRYKIAIGYKSGDTCVYVNGTQVISNTATFSFVSSLTDFILGGYYLPYNGHQNTNASALWKTRLTNAQLATLTTI
jgi:hypothetical protein